MPTYQPGIPTGTEDLNVDYKNIQDNFTVLDTSFGIDHVPFSSTTAQNGYHEDVHFNPFSTTTTNGPNNYVAATAAPPITSVQYPDQAAVAPPAVPPVVAGIGQLWSAEVNDGIGTPDTGLYWLSGNGLKVAMTRNFNPSALLGSGSTFLPGGFILQWGALNIVTGISLVNFPKTFPNGLLNFHTTVITTALAGGTILPRSGPVLTSTSSIQVTNNLGVGVTIFWIALGY